MKIYNIFLITILLLGFITLIALEDKNPEKRGEPLAGKYVYAGFAFFNDNENSGKIDQMDETVPVKTDTVTNDNLFYVDEWIRGWFVRLDKNNNKKISRNEFLDNMELFDITEEDLLVFNTNGVNPDGDLNLNEFNNFVDTTEFLKKEAITKKATSVSGSDDVDIFKLFAGVICISLLIAAFRYV